MLLWHIIFSERYKRGISYGIYDAQGLKIPAGIDFDAMSTQDKLDLVYREIGSNINVSIALWGVVSIILMAITLWLRPPAILLGFL